MNKYQLNITVSVVLILFGILVLIATPYCIQFSNLHSGMTESDLLSSHFMPKVLVGILFFSSFVNIIINSINWVNAKKNSKTLPKIIILRKDEIGKIIAFCFISIFYAILLTVINFLIASIICCILLLLVMRVKKWWYYTIDIGFIIAVYLIFKYLLYVQL